MTNNRIYFAAIDIGSNAIRLEVKGIDSNCAGNTTAESLETEILVRFPLRLGEDAFVLGEISKEKTRQLMHLMKAFRQMMKIYNIVECRAFATSAMRDAANAPKIVRKIRNHTGININIITGEEEATIIYETHMERALGEYKDYLYMDVGGGSTQLSLMHLGEPVYSHSFNIGTVRILNNIVPEDEKRRFLDKLAELCVQYPNLHLIGSGGNIIKISKLLKSSNNELRIDTLETFHRELAPLGIEERMAKYRIKRERAEVIVPAASLFLEAAQVLKVQEIIVPSINTADGIVSRIFSEYMVKR